MYVCMYTTTGNFYSDSPHMSLSRSHTMGAWLQLPVFVEHKSMETSKANR